MKKSKRIMRIVSTLSIFLLLAVFPITSAFADNTAAEFPSSGTNNADTGTVAWQNPGNITADDGNSATVVLEKGSRVSYYLRASGYTFTIPASSTINGIEVVVDRMATPDVNPAVTDNAVYLVKDTTRTGLAKTGSAWPALFSTATYGGPTDLWGTTWTAAEISTIGVDLSVKVGGNDVRTASVNYITVKVYYSSGSTTTAVNCGSGTPTVTYGNTISCVATVTGSATGLAPTGTVSWTSNGDGTFTTSPCNLSSLVDGIATCSVDYMPSAVGTSPHTITATYSGDPSYTGSIGTQAVTVNKANASFVFTLYSVTYDGDPHTATGSATGVKSENLSSLLNLSLTTHTNAGDYPDDPWTFEGNANYNAASGTLHDQIFKANATITLFPYTDVTYDGNAHTASGTATGVKAETLSDLLDFSGTTHTDAGDYPNDDWSFAGNNNYNSANGTVHDQIIKANAVIDVTPYNVTFDGTEHTASGTATGVKGEDLSSSFDFTGTAHTNVGDYPSDGWTFTGGINYNNSSGTVHDIISKANADCTIVPYDVVYDGNPHTATGECLGVDSLPLAGLDLTGTTHTAIGIYNDTWSFTDGTGNYNSSVGSITDYIRLRTFYLPIIFK